MEKPKRFRRKDQIFHAHKDKLETKELYWEMILNLLQLKVASEEGVNLAPFPHCVQLLKSVEDAFANYLDDAARITGENLLTEFSEILAHIYRDRKNAKNQRDIDWINAKIERVCALNAKVLPLTKKQIKLLHLSLGEKFSEDCGTLKGPKVFATLKLTRALGTVGLRQAQNIQKKYKQSAADKKQKESFDGIYKDPAGLMRFVCETKLKLKF